MHFAEQVALAKHLVLLAIEANYGRAAKKHHLCSTLDFFNTFKDKEDENSIPVENRDPRDRGSLD
jgi:hypothetical protein